MFVDDVSTSSRHRLNQILHTLKHVHSFDLKLDESSVDEITTIQNTSEVLKTSIVQEGAFNNWHSNPNYAKHMLIVEATRLYLKEIAPRRRPRNLHEGHDTSSHSKAADVGYWLINFAETSSTDDDKLLKLLNGLSRVGNELTRVGSDGSFQTLKDLIDHYETRANDPMNSDTDRQSAKSDIHALRVGFKLYKKHNADDDAELSSEAMAETDNTVSDVDPDFAQQFPELVALAKKYGIGDNDDSGHDTIIADEGNEFSGALAAARSAHKDKFTVGNKRYTVKEAATKSRVAGVRIAESSHMQDHDYQASMARSELYRNAKYAMDMLKMVRPDEDIEPWIASALTTDAMYLDKIYHYLDYYTKFEPGQLPSTSEQPDFSELDEDDAEIQEATGSIARANLVQIFENSVKLFHMIQPGDKLEGWVAMKLTTASEGISSAKHYLDYKNFERHAAEHFDLAESRNYGLREAKARKDFKLVADLIKQNSDAGARHHMAKQHADVFAKKSPRFNRSKFFAESNANEQYPSTIGRKHRQSIREALDNAEQDLQQAETLIAAKSISDDLQSMAEKVARMGVDELMPLVDTMKTQFGPEVADAYNTVMKAQLDALLTATQEAKDQSDDAVIALQNGGMPGGGATDIENLPDEGMPGEEAGIAAPEEEESDGLGTTPSAAGGGEPLGRAKKPAPGEVPAELAETRRRRLGEKWDTEMKTAEKDKGKWDGWTLAKLRSHRKSLMDKATRTAAEQKEVKQIDFAIRAKQKDKFGDVKKESVAEAKSKPDFLDIDKDGDKKEPMKKAVADKAKAPAKKVAEAKKAKPDFLDVDKDGDKKESMKKAVADKAKAPAKKKVAEAKAKSPYAIGMWQAKKEAGLDPDKPAKDLSKKLITRGHKIARSIDKTDESVARLGGLLETARKGKLKLESLLAKHRAEFSVMVSEGRTKDVLLQGQGLEGDILQNKINEMASMVVKLEDQIHAYNADSRRQMKEAIAQERKAYRFAQAKAANPWGVMFESATGGRDYKFFKDQQARDYWLQLNGNVKAKLIGPEHFDRAASN